MTNAEISFGECRRLRSRLLLKPLFTSDQRPHENRASELNIVNRDLSSTSEVALETGRRAQRVGEDSWGPDIDYTTQTVLIIRIHHKLCQPRYSTFLNQTKSGPPPARLQAFRSNRTLQIIVSSVVTLVVNARLCFCKAISASMASPTLSTSKLRQ